MTVQDPPAAMATRILPVDARGIGEVVSSTQPWIEDWSLQFHDTTSAHNIKLAAQQIRETDVPVAFPSETVYGLGADATRDSAVKAIYRVKGRPSDNPLIVHFASIKQIRELLAGQQGQQSIPEIYQPLIDKFWPGPLTILLPLPNPSPLAPSVTVGLTTFGARIPRNPTALALLRTANVPVAAPSANASTKPSTTSAEHVAHDLQGRISIVLDGGPSDVGVESTVVDGLTSPPAILRPGGVSVEQLRTCAGWEDVVAAYTDKAEAGAAPRAPGMKYKHYSPKARTILFEAGHAPTWDAVSRVSDSLGVIMTKKWRNQALFESAPADTLSSHQGASAVKSNGSAHHGTYSINLTTLASLLPDVTTIPQARQVTLCSVSNSSNDSSRVVWLVDLGPDTRDVARGIFAALRELDLRRVDTIFVEGLDEAEGELSAAVMNRLRKAADPS